MKKLIAVLTVMFLLALPIAYAEVLDNLELLETDLQLEEVDVDSSDVLTDNSIPMDMVHLDLAIGELENTDSNEIVPSQIAAANANGNIAIDVEHFPDPEFRTFILEKFDTNRDGYLSEEENSVVEEINLFDYVGRENIYDLSGICYFEELEKLDCSYMNVTKLDVSMCRKLENLDCGFGMLKSLKVGENIQHIYCRYNQIVDLDVSRCTVLKSLDCCYNQIGLLDFRNSHWIENVECDYNKLTSLKLGECKNLNRIDCSGNLLTSLDISKCGSLRELKCGDNKLKKLTLGINSVIDDLDCSDNKLTMLDIGGCPNLKDLVTPIIGNLNWNQWENAISWGLYDRWYDENPYDASIEIDKSTTLKNGKKILYKPGNPKSIKFTRSNGILKKGSYVNLGKYLRISPLGVASVCKLTSSNKKVVRVSNDGYAYGLKRGTATVTVKIANGKKAKINVTVK